MQELKLDRGGVTLSNSSRLGACPEHVALPAAEGNASTFAIVSSANNLIRRGKFFAFLGASRLEGSRERC